jgi:hypothetical protein
MPWMLSVSQNLVTKGSIGKLSQSLIRVKIVCVHNSGGYLSLVEVPDLSDCSLVRSRPGMLGIIGKLLRHQSILLLLSSRYRTVRFTNDRFT